ncbi:peptide antibiotic transporter SbmA [Vibrio ziniensis]|uniref:Peptide antibiotic transporter SbmA n=1 Tax=Vibrio ziniensis TaxID=2711221 RepID=A0A6G7CP34_9VIBR|nr:peptide antibiotic transporter SbmA [Vibrio ziniensis]QIH43865.1 peptide antibiotic transporter SbmA [Vibrio ziniensis]
MFSAFFPKPKLFFMSFVFWALICVVGWYTIIEDLGSQLSLAHFFGIEYPPALIANASEVVTTQFEQQSKTATEAWLYQFMILCYALFISSWMTLGGQKWAKWSVIGSGLIVFITWFQVKVSVMLNEWYGDFYDLIQKALTTPNSITLREFYSELSTVMVLLMIAIMVAVANSFFVSHYVFRWRTAMTNYYTARWKHVRHIEGAAQRIQEDTMRFATIVESLGVRLLNSVMTLIAFLPILWGLSGYVTTLPFVGEVPQALVFIATIWSIFGTVLLGCAGVKLPGLEFNNQKVEAAYRKELVYGEDHEDRADPLTLQELYSNVRQNYFKLYLHYVYFNVIRYGYLQFGNFIPFIALAPSIVAGAFTLGVMQRIMNAFNQVEHSFQYLVNSWTTIVELLSIYKRLKAFEQAYKENNIDLIGVNSLS